MQKPLAILHAAPLVSISARCSAKLIELDHDIQVCGATLRKMGWDERDLACRCAEKRHEGVKCADDGCG
jgi:hypothetical protein